MNRLKNLLDWTTSLNQLAKTTLLVVGVGLLMFFIGQCGSKNTLDEYITNYNRYVDSTKKVLVNSAQVDIQVSILQDSIKKIQKESARLDKTISKYKMDAVLLRQSIDTLKRSADSAQTVEEELELTKLIVLKQDTLIENRDSTIVADSLRLEQEKKDKALLQTKFDKVTLDRDNLRVQLANIPNAPSNPDKWIFGIRKPSRTTVAIVSFATGIVTYLVIDSKTK